MHLLNARQGRGVSKYVEMDEHIDDYLLSQSLLH